MKTAWRIMTALAMLSLLMGVAMGFSFVNDELIVDAVVSAPVG